MGLKDYSPLDLQKVLAGKSAAVRAGLGSNTDIVSGSAGSSDIETMLQLVHLQFNGVRRDDDLYKSFIAQQVDAARNAMAQPELVFRDAIVTTLYDNHPRVARTPRPEDFAKVSMDRAVAIYKARFGSAKDLTFILVGSFDIAAHQAAAGDLPRQPADGGHPGRGKATSGVRPVTGVVKQGSAQRVGSQEQRLDQLHRPRAVFGRRADALPRPARSDEHPDHRHPAREAGADLRRRHERQPRARSRTRTTRSPYRCRPGRPTSTRCWPRPLPKSSSMKEKGPDVGGPEQGEAELDPEPPEIAARERLLDQPPAERRCCTRPTRRRS